MKRTLSTRRRHRQYMMRPTKLNMRRVVFLLVMVLAVVRIGFWFNSRGDEPRIIELLDEDYNTKRVSVDTQSSSIDASFLKRKSEQEVDYEFDERNSELGDTNIALKTNSSEEYYYHGSEDKIDEGDRGEWSVDSGEEVRSSLKHNTPPVDVGAPVSENIVTNKTNDIQSNRRVNESDVESDSNGAESFLDDDDVIGEDGEIIQDTLAEELADVGGGGDQVSMDTAEHDDANQLQHHQVTAPRGDGAQENDDDYESEEYDNDYSVEYKNNVNRGIVDHENNVDRDIVDHQNNVDHDTVDHENNVYHDFVDHENNVDRDIVDHENNVDRDIVDHENNVDRDIVDHENNVDRDNVDHENNVDRSIVDHENNVDRDIVDHENNVDRDNVDHQNNVDRDIVDHENNVDHDTVDHQNNEKDREENSGGISTERVGEIDHNGVELSKDGSDLHPLDDNSKYVAEERNGEEDNKTSEEKKEEEDDKDDEKEEGKTNDDQRDTDLN